MAFGGIWVKGEGEGFGASDVEKVVWELGALGDTGEKWGVRVMEVVV